MPLTTAVNPQTNETAVLVDGAWQKVDQVAVNPTNQSKAYLVGGKWMTDTPGDTKLPPPPKDPGYVVGAIETAANLASSMVAAPVAGITGLVEQDLENRGMAKPGQAAERIRQVQSALTYQPRTPVGQDISSSIGRGLSYLSEVPGEWAGEHARRLAKAMGASDELAATVGAGTKAGTEVLPQMLLAKGATSAAGRLTAGEGAAEAAAGAPKATPTPGAAPGASEEVLGGVGQNGPGSKPGNGPGSTPPPADAAGRAQAYVANLGLDWGHLSDTFKAKLTEIASDAQGLSKLNPAAVKRQGLLAQVGIDRATRGQIARDPSQRGNELALQATETGKPLRELDQEQNAALLRGVDELRAKVRAEALPSGSKASGDLPVGRSVQDAALRPKAERSQKRVDALYRRARESEPDATAPADSLYELLEQKPHIQRLGWVNSWLKRAKVETSQPAQDASTLLDAQGNPARAATPATTARRGVTLNELNDLRQEANGVIKGGGTDAYYAGQVKRAIDAAMETVPDSAKAWKEATAAARAHFQEFGDQQAVRGLVEDKPMSSDRRVAIENTAKKTILGNLEDLQKVKRSLLTGGDATSRTAGKIAWRDLKGWTIDYIRDSMTKGPKGEAEGVSTAGSDVGEGHATWVGLKKALDNISDENLDEIFGPSVRKQLRRYQDAAEVAFTKASTRTVGSNTFDKILTFLDRIGHGPLRVVTDPIALATKGVQKATEFGKERREVEAATTTPLDEALSKTRRDVRRSQNLSNLKKYSKSTAPAAPAAQQSSQE